MSLHTGHFYTLLLSAILTILTSIHTNAVTLSEASSYALPSGSGEPYSVAFSPDGSYLATANEDSTNVTIFQVGAGGVLSGSSVICITKRF